MSCQDNKKKIAIKTVYLIGNLLYSKDILNYRQMKDEKQKLIINTTLNLVYNTQIIKNRDNTLLCLLIDIKETFDYISLIQSINILKRLDMLRNIVNQLICFFCKNK